jgi:hypothetical protein
MSSPKKDFQGGISKGQGGLSELSPLRSDGSRDGQTGGSNS